MSIYSTCVLLSTTLWLRTLDAAISGKILTATEQTDILAMINYERQIVKNFNVPGYPQSVPLPTVTWDAGLALTAKQQVEVADGNGDCVQYHVGNYVEGQAMSWNPSASIEELFQGWRNEKWGYDWATDYCDTQKSPSGCGHYFGLLNAGFDLMGCAVAHNCAVSGATNIPPAKLVCHYGRSASVAPWSSPNNRPYDCQVAGCPLKGDIDYYPNCVRILRATTATEASQSYDCGYKGWIWGKPYWNCTRKIPNDNLKAWVFFQGVKWAISLNTPPTNPQYFPNGVSDAYCYADSPTPGEGSGKWVNTAWNVRNRNFTNWCKNLNVPVQYNAAFQSADSQQGEDGLGVWMWVAIAAGVLMIGVLVAVFAYKRAATKVEVIVESDVEKEEEAEEEAAVEEEEVNPTQETMP